MADILPRTAWTTTRNGRAGRPLQASKVYGIAIHYPAAGNVTYRNYSQAQVAGLLRGWRAYHTGKGWADIGYNFAVDGAGRVWDLTGFNIGAHAGAIGNPSRVGVLFVLGNGEAPSAAMIEGFQDLRRHVLGKYPKAVHVEGHQQVPGNATACPGQAVMSLIASGAILEPVGGTSKAPTRGKRVDRARRELRTEIKRLWKARKAARKAGKPVRRKRLTAAIKSIRAGRQALARIRKR